MSQPYLLSAQRLQPEYPLFIYLPGMDGTGQLLRSQNQVLENYFDVRCLAIPLNDKSNWQSLTYQVLKLIHTELGQNSQRPVYLCGESFGGCLAQKMAMQAPHLFDKIILINPASSFRLHPWLSWTSQLMHWLPDYCFEIGAQGLLPFLAAVDKIADGDRQHLLNAMRSIPPETILWRISLLREFHLEERKLQRIAQPVLVIAGAEDKLLPSKQEARRLVRVLPNGTMTVLPHSGHACLLEKGINLYEIMQRCNFF
ncbi:MAG: alpha/beta hydrolase [Calothrix sp. MO_167.B12]|nr:alpha/beta hydrolase [Calothrix sp. MO_167.B12]